MKLKIELSENVFKFILHHFLNELDTTSIFLVENGEAVFLYLVNQLRNLLLIMLLSTLYVEANTLLGMIKWSVMHCYDVN